MAEQGGYRRPENPAPVSGPGALSKRTDGAQPARYMSGGPYGEGQELMELQTSAPMSEAPQAVSPRMPRGGGAGRRPMGGTGEVTPLFAPTERPMEPLTAGAPFGPGPSPRQGTRTRSLTGTLEKLMQVDDSGVLSQWYRMAQLRGW